GEQGHWHADLGFETMRQTLDGVKLISKAPDGYVGGPQGFSSDEMASFIFELPGVEDYGFVTNDEGVATHMVQASDEDAAAKLRAFLPEYSEVDSGGPVVIGTDPF